MTPASGSEFVGTPMFDWLLSELYDYRESEGIARDLHRRMYLHGLLDRVIKILYDDSWW